MSKRTASRHDAPVTRRVRHANIVHPQAPPVSAVLSSVRIGDASEHGFYAHAFADPSPCVHVPLTPRNLAPHDTFCARLEFRQAPECGLYTFGINTAPGPDANGESCEWDAGTQVAFDDRGRVAVFGRVPRRVVRTRMVDGMTLTVHFDGQTLTVLHETANVRVCVRMHAPLDKPYRPYVTLADKGAWVSATRGDPVDVLEKNVSGTLHAPLGPQNRFVAMRCDGDAMPFVAGESDAGNDIQTALARFMASNP